MSNRLSEIVSSFEGAKVLVLGDLILDNYIWGRVDRISPEAPVVVVNTTEESKRPGGAGNVVNNLSSLGAQVSLCGVVGDDDAGRSLLQQLADEQIDTSGVVIDSSRPTTTKTRVIAHAQQVVRVDKEDTSPLSQSVSERLSVLLKERIAENEGIIISDYAKGAVKSGLFSVVEQAYSDGVLGLGKKAVLVDPKDPNFDIYSKATIIKPNKKEAQEASGEKITDKASAIRVGKTLLEKWDSELVLITLGEDGMVLVSNTDSVGDIEVETKAREVYDVSGAGDTVAAVFLLALSVGASPKEAAILSNYAAGVVVAEVGTVAIKPEQLIAAVEKHGGCL